MDNPLISNEDLAYIAGFIDGEGCVTLAKQVQNIRGVEYVVYYPLLNIANNYKPALDWVKETVGYGSVCKKSRDARTNRVQGWYYSAQYAKATAVLKLVRPYLKIKGKQADIAIEFQETKGIRDSKFQGSVPVEIMAIRMGLVAQIRLLNKRGLV